MWPADWVAAWPTHIHMLHPLVEANRPGRVKHLGAIRRLRCRLAGQMLHPWYHVVVQVEEEEGRLHPRDTKPVM